MTCLRKAQLLTGEIKKFKDISKGDIFKLIEPEGPVTNWLECISPPVFDIGTGVHGLKPIDVILDKPEKNYSIINSKGDIKPLKDIKISDIFQLIDSDNNVVYLRSCNVIHSWFMSLTIESISYNNTDILKVQVKRLPAPPDMR